MPPGVQRDTAGRRDQTSAAAALATPQEKARRRFTAGLIAAIEELEARRTARPQQALADAAWHKLQYDLPLLEECELSALLAVLSASFEGKAGWPCYQLTAKALENIAAGARGSGASHAPPLSAQEQAVQDALTQAHTAAGKAGAGSSSNQHHVSRQALYQQLLAVLLLQYTAKVVSLPESDASQLLARYTAPGDEDDEGQGSPHWQQQGPLVDDAAAAEAGLNSAATTAAACVVYEDVEAAQQDEDSDAYEPLDEVMSHQQQQCSATSGHTQQQQRSEPFSPQALVAKLLSLADHVHYSLLSHEPLWQQQGSSSGGGGGAAQHLLQLLRLLGVHSRSRDLQPLLHACVGVLVDRLAAAPGDLPLLHQLWAALGLTGGAGSALSGGASTCGQRQQQEGLPPEAVLGFTVAAAVWQQLPGVGARRQLWQAMCDDLLPLLEQCTEQLAFSTGTAGMTTAAAAGASFAHMLLVCHIVELLVLGRPAHADVAAQLTQLGVTRNLVTLFVKWGCDAAAEPLRRAVLLCSCASPSTAAWVLAVPRVGQQLQQAALQLAGAHESHGAMWQLIASTSSSKGNTPSGAAAQVHQQQLLALLEPPSDCDNNASASSRQLQRQVLMLQLMADAQRAAGSKQRLFDAQVLAALRKLAAALKDAAEASSNAAADDSKQAHAVVAAAAADTVSDEPEGASDDEGKHGSKAVAAAAGARVSSLDASGGELEGRRSAQLQPAALRLIKDLLTQGGGKTD